MMSNEHVLYLRNDFYLGCEQFSWKLTFNNKWVEYLWNWECKNTLWIQWKQHWSVLHSLGSPLSRIRANINRNAKNEIFSFNFPRGGNEWKIPILPAPGIDPGTSRTPGKCLNHYTTGVGSQILRICSLFIRARTARADWCEHHAEHVRFRLAIFSIWPC